MENHWYNKTWFLAFLLIPFFKPIGPCYYEVFNSTFQWWKLISIIFILVLILVSNNGKIYFSSSKKGYWGLFLFWIIYIINCLRYGTDAKDIVNNAITSIILICFIGFCAKHDPTKLLKVLRNIFIVYCSAQTISVLGIAISQSITGGSIYFLGTDNFSAFSLLPMLGVILFSSMICKRKIGLIEWMCVISILIDNIITWSVTAMLAMIFALMLMIFYHYRVKILKLFSLRNFLVFLSILLILIIVFHIEDYMSFFFVKVLHKDITLSSRSIIWNEAMKLIKENFVFGFGNLSNQQVSSYVLYGANHAHNMLLELLLRTGIIGCIGYLSFLTGILQNGWKKYANTSAYVLEIFILAQLLLFFADFYATIMYFYCFMAIIYNLKYFLKIK